MSSFLRYLVGSSKVPLYLDLRTGSFRDMSLSGNYPTVITGVLPTKSQVGFGRTFPASCTCSIPESTSLNCATGLSLVALVRQNDLGTDRRIACKRGTADYWDLFVTSAGTLSFKSGATTVTLAMSPTSRANSFGVTWTTTQIPNAYRNNSLVGPMSGALTAGGTVTGVCNIGSYLAGSASNAWSDHIYAIVLVNEALANADMVRLMRELSDAPGIVARPRKGFSLPYPSKTPAEVTAESILFDLKGEPVGGKLPDVATGAYPATIFGPAPLNIGQADLVKNGPFDCAVTLRTAHGVLPAAVYPNIFASTYTMEFWVKPYVTAGTVILFGTGGVGLIYLASNAYRMHLAYVNGVGVGVGVTSASAACFATRRWVHAVYTLTYSAPNVSVELFCDGVSVAAASSAAGMTAAVASALLNRYAPGLALNFESDYAKVTYYSRALTPAQVREKFLEGARKCVLDARAHSDGSSPVTPTALGVSCEIANGWTVQSGTWKVVEDAPANGVPGQRWIQCATAGNVSCKADKQAYGSWYHKVRVNSVEHEWLFIATDPTSVSAAAQNGYGIHISAARVITLRERAAGAATALITPGVTLVAATTYEFWVTRRFDGLFEWWIKGGVYTDWTSLGTATDTTTTSGGYEVQYAGAANAESAGALAYLGGMTPTEAIGIGLLKG